MSVISANSRSIAESLHHTFHLMSVLANFLRMHHSVASDVNVCLAHLHCGLAECIMHLRTPNFSLWFSG